MGEVFAGRYELIDLVGEGGMGTVWRAWDRKAGAVVAAKVLKQSDAATMLRFVREQSFRIHDEHVLTPIGWAGEDDKVLFTMPLVTGGSVANLIADFGPLPPLLVAEILRQILSGLAAVHQAGLVHRDIKPANILLDATGTGRPHAYVSDFGIAVDLNAPRWTETGVVSGTPGYLAPEIEQLDEVTPQGDLYAAGQVALTMLTGAKPKVRGLGFRPTECPESLWSVLTQLVAARPEGRPASAAAAGQLLSGPDLAWSPNAIGEVEVFDHADDQTIPRGGAAGTPVQSIATTDPETPAPSDPTSVPPAQRPKRTTVATQDVLVFSAVGATLLTGLVLIWSPWAGSDGGPPLTPPATSGSSTTSVTTSTTPSITGPTLPTSTTTPVPPTTGSFESRQVVLRIGQPCEAAQAEGRSRTLGGVDVICRLQAGGSYAWVRP